MYRKDIYVFLPDVHSGADRSLENEQRNAMKNWHEPCMIRYGTLDAKTIDLKLPRQPATSWFVVSLGIRCTWDTFLRFYAKRISFFHASVAKRVLHTRGVGRSARLLVFASIGHTKIYSGVQC